MLVLIPKDFKLEPLPENYRIEDPKMVLLNEKFFVKVEKASEEAKLEEIKINKDNDCVWYLRKESKKPDCRPTIQIYKTVGLNLEPAIEGRVPTQWLLDNIHKISKEDFYNQELSEEDLRKKTDREEKEALEVAKMSKKCPLCGAKMKYVTDAKTLDDGSCVRDCVCENGHEFIERTIFGVKG